MKQVAIFISGAGSNMQKLIETAQKNSFPVNIAFVLSDNPQAKGIYIAQQKGIKTFIIPKKKEETKQEHEASIFAVLENYKIDYILLAGYMRLLSKDFCTQWDHKIINIHPSLLPSFKGLNTHQRAIENKVKFTGCTIHYVTKEMDSGDIIAQAALMISPQETADTLAKRVLALEHILYPKVLYNLVYGAEKDVSFFSDRDPIQN